jgi:hypothetical protein
MHLNHGIVAIEVEDMRTASGFNARSLCARTPGIDKMTLLWPFRVAVPQKMIDLRARAFDG